MLSFLPTAAPVPGGWFRAVVKESGMKDGGESAAEMRPR